MCKFVNNPTLLVPIDIYYKCLSEKIAQKKHNAKRKVEKISDKNNIKNEKKGINYYA